MILIAALQISNIIQHCQHQNVSHDFAGGNHRYAKMCDLDEYMFITVKVAKQLDVAIA